jgi:hypothetical protein
MVTRDYRDGLLYMSDPKWMLVEARSMSLGNPLSVPVLLNSNVAYLKGTGPVTWNMRW